jgi:hypothetical protein
MMCVGFVFSMLGKKNGILFLRRAVLGCIGVGSSHVMFYRGIHESEDHREKVGTGGGTGKAIKIDDCEIPACHSTKEMMKLAKQKRKTIQQQGQQQQQPSSPLSASASLQHHQHPHHHQNPYQSGCPVMREHLGVSTWNLIHTIAANFPENPNEDDKKNIEIFFKSLAYLYPCPHCAEDFQSSVLKNPPK